MSSDEARALYEPSNITAKKLEDINVSASTDTSNCCITGSDVVLNSMLIIADWNNSKVKLLETNTNKLLSDLKVSSQPWDITGVNGTHAAVTLPANKKILIMKVSSSLSQESEIAVRGRCRGVAYNQDRLLVTFMDNPRLEIIDLHGNVIRTIEKNSGGNKLFTLPWYVCVSRDGKTIYVSDGGRDTVTSLTCDGVMKAVYQDAELRGPHKVCTDHHGNAYVCGSMSKNVHMLTANCKKIKVILTQAGGLGSYVRTVSHCQDTNKLLIGMAGDVVEVYQLF